MNTRPAYEARPAFRILAAILGTFALVSLFISIIMLITQPGDRSTPITVAVACGVLVYPCWKLALTGRLFTVGR